MGVLSIGSLGKVRLSSVDFGWEEGLHLIWGAFAGLSRNGTPAKRAHKMTNICPTTLPSLIYPT